jgi:hypothetical protein
MFSYCPGYQNVFIRALYSFFITLPEQLWMRWLCLVIPSSKTLINKTGVTDAVLMASWASAQQGLATAPFPLNDSGGQIHPADPRALTVQPKNLTVVSVPDWSPTDLAKIDPAWAGHAVPTGSFAIMQGSGLFGYETVAGMTCPWTRPRVYGATSVLANVCVYEFQNVILKELGYDVSAR